MYPDKLHIVLAEDDQDDRLLFERVFNHVRINHTLKMCDDGQELMEYLRTTDEKPHIIFLDLNMPKKSGLECLAEIRKDERLRDITIAIYSTSSVAATIEQAFILGSNVYIKKPNEFDDLKKILTEVIYINWQYITDGLNKENFMVNY
ncbi:response regulator [Flavobacterium sp. J372]|uniref:response regulator n=1 Tax=Flavobacterium sp. J372 TaxID=2898436 RepID=UPI0021517471|nr:response regulator [Flavobacterium sp. J372]MCR5862062.1 response regulator [Flavobacterium sp. J372]